jgi:hypothetical protein
MRRQSRRGFLRTASLTGPAVTLALSSGLPLTPEAGRPEKLLVTKKATPLDLSPYFTASASDVGLREQAKQLRGESKQDGLIRTPGGPQVFRGLPFLLGPAGVQSKSWLVLSNLQEPWATAAAEITLPPVPGKTSYLCLAGFCDWDANETPPDHVGDAREQVGQRLAQATLVYQDGGSRALSIRRRFEVNAPTTFYGHLCFAAVPHLKDVPRKLTDPLPDATAWGDLQLGVWYMTYPAGPWAGTPHIWLSALANPEPERPLKALRFQAASGDLLMICGATLFHGDENPLRYERRTFYRFTLPEPVVDPDRWKVDVDLGVVTRTSTLDFDPAIWLRSPYAGLGERGARPPQNHYHLYAEVVASPEAVLVLSDAQTGKKYAFDAKDAEPPQELPPGGQAAGVEVIEKEKVWLDGRVLDAATGKPTPVRISFRSQDGRYLPPHGHRRDINAGWFQDYGADIKLGDSSFACIDGTFRIELPVGDVYVEISKGFEYQSLRRKLRIEAQQQTLDLAIQRFAHLQENGWACADTHVHFLSPSTAILEGQAEGLNLINVLSAQWAELFTNVGDFSHGPLTSRDGRMIVWVGSENRQHMLGHLSVLGIKGSPVYPLSAAGPEESFEGDPLWNTLAEWADECRKRDGLVVAPHFPYPTGEIAADIVLGKIDAVEIWPLGNCFNTLRVLDWYRYLNSGYRLPCVGGTDKMGAWTSPGANRGYAYLGQDEFNFDNWAKAVRRGNTFMTSGPLLQLQVEGHAPGAEITLGAGGGTLEVQAEASSYVDIHSLEIVWNGRVVASRQESAGARRLVINEKVPVTGPGWIAARCAAQLIPAVAWEFGVQAHTSPVYVRVPGQELFSASDIAYMLTLVEGSEVWVENWATRPDAARLAKIRKVFSDAREILHRRLHQHGIPHD